MIAVRYYPELVTPELLEWLAPFQNGSSGQWIVPRPPLPETLKAIAAAICPDVPADEWNTVALQYYKDGRADTPCHADDAVFGFVLSIGATRTLRLHRMADSSKPTQCGDPDLDAIAIECRQGTVVLMQAAFHNTWHHQIPAEPGVTAQRLSLVFRTKPKRTP